MKITALMTASGVFSKAGAVLIAILFFGLLVMAHEAGHFLFAKLFGVKVNEFAFGMGPTLFSRKKGETKYAVHLFPIGGFVSMEGEEEDCEGERAFCNKPAWQRFIIVAAGATVNLIMGFLIVLVMLAVTTKPDEGIGTTEILQFREGAVSSASLQEGDVIKKIGNKHVFSVYDVSYLMSRDSDGVMDITVKRGGETVALKDVTFQSMKGKDGTNTIIYDFILRGVNVNFLNVVRYGFDETVTMGRMVWLSFYDLVTGQYGLSDLSGPIGTVAYVAEAADVTDENWDLSYVLLIMALISVNIGLFNLFPIPALDGGRLFFILIEMVFRKPVPQKYERWVHAAGMVLLLGFMAVVSLSDILKLIRGEF